MKPSSLLKSAWLTSILAAVALIALAGGGGAGATRPRRTAGRPLAASLPLIALPTGEQGLADVSGHVVPLRRYQRIASGSTVTDDLLLELAEPERVVMLTHYGRTHNPDAHRYGQRATFGGPADLERMQQHGVDLLVLNHFGAPAELARARDAGLTVFNLGEMRGLATLLPNIEALAVLLGDRARGERLAARFARRIKAVAADIPARARKRAMYVAAHGGQLFGGGKRTSYHDVLTAAGLIDVAAEHFDGFPHYDPEQLLSLDPEIIVTQQAAVPLFCRIGGLGHLRACRDGGGGVVGMDDALLSDPGLEMLEAAEVLRERVYGAR
jgi:iron complex transport system substrate-binding protein